MTLLTCLMTAFAAGMPTVEDKPADQIEVTADVVMVVAAEAEPGTADTEVKIIRMVADGEEGADGAHARRFVWKTGEDCDEQASHTIKLLAPEANANHGWLGIALGTVSKEVAGENNLEDNIGVTVLNVVKDSPAERAGLEQGDVVTAINDTTINDVGDLAELVRGMGPGVEVRMTVVRDGETSTRTAVLASRSEKGIEWIHEHTPNVIIHEHFRPGGAIRVGPGGQVFKLKLGEEGGFEGLPQHLADVLQEYGADRSISVSRGGEDNVLELVWVENDEVLEISQEGEGPIVVTRYTEGADERDVIEYITQEALLEGDADAHRLYNESQQRAIFVDPDGNHTKLGFKIEVNDLEIDFDVDDESIQQRVEQAIAKAHEQLEQAHAGAELGMLMRSVEVAKAMRSFKVQPDGSIELTLRRGDTEVVKVYSDEADLEARNPAAFERFAEVLDAADEE